MRTLNNYEYMNNVFNEYCKKYIKTKKKDFIQQKYYLIALLNELNTDKKNEQLKQEIKTVMKWFLGEK